MMIERVGHGSYVHSAVGARRRILHVLSTFGVGGPQVRLARTINALGARYHHMIVAVDGRYDARELIDDHADVAFIVYRFPKTLGPTAIGFIRKAIRHVEPDLLVTYNWGAIDWAMANSFRPIVRHVHFEDGFGLDEATGQLPRRRIYRKWALRRVAALVVPSSTLVTIAQATWGVAAERIRYLINGVDVARFQRPATPAVEKSTDELLIGTVSPLRPEKNVARLIRLYAALPQRTHIRLIVAGDGPERDKLKGLASSLGVAGRTVFLGHVAAPETVLQVLDAFVVTSETEQMPLSVLEAMAVGLPIVSFDLGDIRQAVSEQNRPFVVERGDEAGLRDALSALLSEGELRRIVGEANRRKAATDFTEERMIADMGRIFLI